MAQEAPLRLLIIGAGARGNAYARAVTQLKNASVVAVAEPIDFKREALGKNFIWGKEEANTGQSFRHWKDYVQYEHDRQDNCKKGRKVLPGVDGVFICTMDETHKEIIQALAPLGLHIMCEKPLATSLNDCLEIYRTLEPSPGSPSRIFSVGHVLRYSPFNLHLRKVLLEEEAIGDVISMEHTEPVGWWHFAHSYVRGNWRKESITAPSLMTKSCHDVDFLLWLLCSPPASSQQPPHLPAYITSTGSLTYFKQSRKPVLAQDATNCMSCSFEKDCIYSAKRIYEEHRLAKGEAGWPVHIIDPEIEDLMNNAKGDNAIQRLAIEKLRKRLAEDYDRDTPRAEVDRRPWFGRCVYESDNDVCDNQVVTITWKDDLFSMDAGIPTTKRLKGRGAKTATLHMVAFTEKQCERRGRIYGTRGEIEYDSQIIKVHDFATGNTETHHPQQASGGHGGGDGGLTRQFVQAINAVKNHGTDVSEAQQIHVGCTLEDVIRSHAMVFAAEEARKSNKVVDWEKWWLVNVMRN